MVKSKRAPVIRKNATPVRVYNEALCVYLYDEANTNKLKDLLHKHRLKQDFFNNLQAKAFQKTVRDEALCVAYTLDQDDPVSVEVGLGEPLTESELKIARWHEPQKALLSLPSGRLRIDTPNTMPLDPDPPIDPGGVVEVKPGEYLLTLYRIDWGEMRRSGIRKTVPDEFILLTPSTGKPKENFDGPILKFPLKQDKTWIQNFEVEEKEIKAKLFFHGYWEGFYVNIEPAAARKIGLQPGHRLRIETERLKFEALYIDRLDSEDYEAFFGKEQITKQLESFKEFAIGGWSKTEGREILQFVRPKSTRAVSERHQDAWIPARVTALPERWPFPDPKEFRPAMIQSQNELMAEIILVTGLHAFLNVGKSVFTQWNKESRELFKFETNGEIRTMVLAENEKKAQLYQFLTGKFATVYESSMEYVFKQGGKVFAYDSKASNPYSGKLPVKRIPGADQMPLVGYFIRSLGSEPLLRIKPMMVDGNPVDAPRWVRDYLQPPAWTRAKKGSSVTLRFFRAD